MGSCLRRIGPGHITTSRSTDALVPARAEGIRSFAGQDDHANAVVLARALKGVDQLDHRLRPERVAHLGPVDRDLGDAGVLAVAVLVAAVLALAGRLPGRSHAAETTV